MKKNRLTKPERLYLQKDLLRLFNEGDSFVAYPLRIVFLIRKKELETPPISILISVPKKKFKHAVDRNYVKRLIRENFRLKKQSLIHSIASPDLQIQFAAIFISTERPSFKKIEKAMDKAFCQLEKKVTNIIDKSISE